MSKKESGSNLYKSPSRDNSGNLSISNKGSQPDSSSNQAQEDPQI